LLDDFHPLARWCLIGNDGPAFQRMLLSSKRFKNLIYLGV
jgi:hypothetical protein